MATPGALTVATPPLHPVGRSPIAAEHASHKLMSITTLLAFTPWPAVSASILFILLVTALYLARGTAHQALSATANALSKGLPLASHSVAHAAPRLAARNRDEIGRAHV